jgi:formyltetrahydrofolate deformylase
MDARRLIGGGNQLWQWQRPATVQPCVTRDGSSSPVPTGLPSSTQGDNIIHSNQDTTDPTGGVFFLRVGFDLPDLLDRAGDLRSAFAAIAVRQSMEWRLALAGKTRRLAIFVSTEDHRLQELLWQQRAGNLVVEIALVIGNQAHLGTVVSPWDEPIPHVPVTPAIKDRAEARQLDLLDAERVDLVVLARSMQLLSPALVALWRNRIIIVHHVVFSAFAGANPHAKALTSGVKLIVATANYVAEGPDAEQIIVQNVRRVDHRVTIADLRRIGRQIERAVFAHAVGWYVGDRIIVHGPRTVVVAWWGR